MLAPSSREIIFVCRGTPKDNAFDYITPRGVLAAEKSVVSALTVMCHLAAGYTRVSADTNEKDIPALFHLEYV